VDFLMIVNSAKTEIVVFDKQLMQFEIDGEIITSTPTMKALGLTFQSDLKWSKHVEATLKKIRPKLSMLRKIRKNLDLEQFLRVATAQLYSIMYYASAVWLNETLKSEEWKKLRSMHYRILRAGIRDYKQRVSKKVIDVLCKRATPQMWSNYSTNTVSIKIIRDRSPQYLYNLVMETFYIERRKPDLAKFYDNSRGKIGKHRLCNRLTNLSSIPGWYGMDLNDHEIRTTLKKHLNFEFDTY